MAAVPSDVYGHIYSFLVQQKFFKAAKALKKEALVVSTIFRSCGVLLVLLSVKVSRIFIRVSLGSFRVFPTINFLVQDAVLVTLAKPTDIF